MSNSAAIRLILTGLLCSCTVRSDAAPLSRKTYLHRAEQQINGIDQQLHRVESKLTIVKSASRMECEKDLRNLWKKEKLARARLDAIRHASSTGWQKLRDQENTILVGLHKSYTHLINQYFR